MSRFRATLSRLADVPFADWPAWFIVILGVIAAVVTAFVLVELGFG